MNILNTANGPHRWRVIAVATLVMAALTTGAMVVAKTLEPQQGQPYRQSEVAEKGRQVMPFDLDRTTHTFTATFDGGRQTVTADDATDTEQIRLIREHLRKEEAAFRAGDFADPATIHGEDMPGLAALEGGAGRVAVAYSDLPHGAQLTYHTSEPALIEAIHAWFAAQTSDHGTHSS